MKFYSEDKSVPNEAATLGGGCFWCLEAVYETVRGVEGVVSGYAGGDVPDATYEQVSSGTSGHAEVVQLTFDPQTLAYRDILRIFFTIHDPTTLNRQGGDIGTQYRSIILYHTQEQKLAAEEVLAEIENQGVWDEPIVTAVEPLEAFYRAEDKHQNYFKNNSQQPYCQVVIAPKVAKFRKAFQDRLKIG